MIYSPTWANANTQGRLQPAEHLIRLSDIAELADAVNRRRLLAFLPRQDFSSQLGRMSPVRAMILSGGAGLPFEAFRAVIVQRLIEPLPEGMLGDPPSPSAMNWLWPLADDDEGKIITAGPGDGGHVSLLPSINGGSDWTDPILTAGLSAVRAVHINELRAACELLSRGRWEMPIYLSCGIFSVLPDAAWMGEAVVNNGLHELRCIGFARLRRLDENSDVQGLAGVTVRASSFIELTADCNCTLEVSHCVRPIDFESDPPTWNEYLPGQELAWQSPGCNGGGDCHWGGQVQLSAGVPGAASGTAMAAAIQGMVDGEEMNFMIRRIDSGPQTIAISARLVVEFDLACPPN